MIFDHIDNRAKYRHIPWLFDTLEAMLEVTEQNFSAGKIALDGELRFLNCNDYHSKPEAEAFFEAHKTYIDIHMLVAGAERIGHNAMTELEETQAYNQKDDYALYRGAVKSQFALKPGWFLVLMPGEPHMVGLNPEHSSVPVKKIVAKIAESVLA